MTTPSIPDKAAESEPPLWSIAIAAIVILSAPLVLYSLAPAGPIRPGDTVFSEGQQQVHIHHLQVGRLNKTDESCLLDPSTPLIVINFETDQAGDSIVAQVQGNGSGEWPFCPVYTEILFKTHQVFQKPAVIGTVRDILVGLFAR
ncbi:MAG TPA: hypothetical protein PKD12_11225 [Nitrospira sp.]|nr:hypothetical protein [Nitrospira sp.]